MSATRGQGVSETRLELTKDELDIGQIYNWAIMPSCGAVVVFSGIVRDNAESRKGVTSLTYEAYEDRVIEKLEVIATEMRKRWVDLGRIALIHRVGQLQLGESSVVVAVSSPHRPEAFAAAQFGIDALKLSVPIWKQEHWAEGTDWSTNSHPISDARNVGKVTQR
ncbi:MAG: molybdenum cofactor biosynthesis protein MoaE [Actinobacteria bacterium]|nr:molybdenum cofactor biosynthesis protein MoaE [Actinomycetota bacterium]